MVQAVEVGMSIAHRYRWEPPVAVDTFEALPLRRMLQFRVLPHELQMAECFRTVLALVDLVFQLYEGVILGFAIEVHCLESAAAAIGFHGRVHQRAGIGQI